MLLISKLCSQLHSSFIKIQLIANFLNPWHQSRILPCFKVKNTFQGWLGFFCFMGHFYFSMKLKSQCFQAFLFKPKDPGMKQENSDCHVVLSPQHLGLQKDTTFHKALRANLTAIRLWLLPYIFVLLPKQAESAWRTLFLITCHLSRKYCYVCMLWNKVIWTA